MIERFAEAAKDAKNDKQHGAVVLALTAMAKLAGLWVERAENINPITALGAGMGRPIRQETLIYRNRG
jgi:hypothetical protein